MSKEPDRHAPRNVPALFFFPDPASGYLLPSGHKGRPFLNSSPIRIARTSRVIELISCSTATESPRSSGLFFTNRISGIERPFFFEYLIPSRIAPRAAMRWIFSIRRHLGHRRIEEEVGALDVILGQQHGLLNLVGAVLLYRHGSLCKISGMCIQVQEGNVLPWNGPEVPPPSK